MYRLKVHVCEIQKDYLFSGWLCQPKVINKGQAVWLDGARPANTCILGSFL